MKILKKWFPLIILPLLVGIIVFFPALFEGKKFYWTNDQQYQYYIYYQEWNNIIQEIKSSHILSIYSWNTFLGTDFFVTKLSFACDFIATPFFILYNGNVNYDILLCCETIICLVLSAVTMKLFLEKFGIKSSYVVNIFSLIYAFSGFAMIYSGSYMFHRFYCLFPLLFYFCEKYIQENKLFGFSIIVTLLFLQNFELMFYASLFLIIYFIFSKAIKGESNITLILKKAFPLIVSYFVGIFLAGFALVPLMMFVKDGSRIGNYSFDGIFWSLGEIIYYLSNLFYAPISIISDNPPHLFYSLRYEGFEYSIFISSLVIIALMNLSQLPKKEKLIFIVVEILINLCLLIKPLNMIVRGLSEPTFRWSFVLLFFNCLLSVYVFDKCDLRLNLKLLIIYASAIVIIFFYFIYVEGKLNDYYFISILLYLLSIIMALFLCIISNNFKKIVLLISVIECIVCYAYTIRSAWNQYPDKTNDTFNREFLEYYKSIDEDNMYRTYFNPLEISPFSSLCLNSATEYNYMSTTTYDSTYPWILNDFLIRNNYQGHIININNPELLKMLGVKYVGVYDDNAVIEKLNVEYSYDLDNIKMFKIKDYNHIGHTYTSFIKESDKRNNIDWNNTLIVSDDIFDELNRYNKIPKAQLIVEEYNRQYFKGSLDTQGDSILFVSIPYSAGWNVFDQNKNKLQTINVQGGFLGIKVNEKVKELSFYYRTPGLIEGLTLSGVGIMLVVSLLIYDKRNRRDDS